MITEKMLIEAAEELNTAFLNSLPDTSECRHFFSAGFERKMKRLITKTSHPMRYLLIKRAASFVLILFLGFMTVLAISPTVRASVVGWVREQLDYWLQYSFYSNTEENTQSKAYYLSYISNEYEEIERIETPGNTNVHYLKSRTAQQMHFVYTNSLSSVCFYLDNNNYISKELLIDGITLDYYESKNTAMANAICGYDHASNMFFCISAYEDQEELVKMYKGIKEF